MSRRDWPRASRSSAPTCAAKGAAAARSPRRTTRRTRSAPWRPTWWRSMERLGFARFSVAGHDRGGRVAYRMAIDHPDRVDRLAVLDVLPTEPVWERAAARFALRFWPWSLLPLWPALGHPVPGRPLPPGPS